MGQPPPSLGSRLSVILETIDWPAASLSSIDATMRRLIAEGLASLPLPASGQTLERWRALAAVGAADLPLAKIYEGHTDARAILAELGTDDDADQLGAVWAAEGPDNRVMLQNTGKGLMLSGRKGWCSGAAIVDYALVSAWTSDGESVLARVALRQPGVALDEGSWRAVGMATSASVAVRFDGARATRLGAPGSYVSRPGFWHGGAGIAAVWYGAAVAIGCTLATSPRIADDPHAAAHLGSVDVSLTAAAAVLRETAAWIDAQPTADAAPVALRARAIVEAAANDVLTRAGRALGAAPLCLNAAHAQRCADLPVFLRQSHAERDLAALGGLIAPRSSAWAL